MSRDPSRRRSVLGVTPAELRDRIRIRIDRELIDQIDHKRGGVSRSQYIEMVLQAALKRPEPHLPDDWTPEQAADERYERLVRYLDTGH